MVENNSAVEATKDVVKVTKKTKKIFTLFNINTLAIAIIAPISIMVIGAIGGTSESNSGSYELGGGGIALSSTTLQWEDAVVKEAEEQQVTELIPYIMAIIEVESRGTGTDIMQSSESAGLPPNAFTDPIQSIEQGIKYLKNSFAIAESLGLTDPWAIVQSYNFGTSYVSYLATQSQNHSVEVAEKYSKDVVAPSLGNKTGTTYSYVNAVSQANGKTYLYSNGGNFYYADLVRQYVGIGSADIPIGNDVFQTIMAEAIKYQGNPYVWGGDHPSVGFDCSGLIQWIFAQAGINLPRVTVDQYAATVEIPMEEAQPGDLIFFKGTYGAPDYISHVGIYIDETRMYDANGSGVGYHYHQSPYWLSHFAGVRRVVNQ